MNKQELKIQGLREALRDRVASITDDYENRIVDLRIELTEVLEAYQEKVKEVEALTQEKNVQEEASASSAAEDSDSAN